jgi:hypothetical protein
MGSRGFGIIWMLIGTATATAAWGTRWIIPGIALLLLGFAFLVADLVVQEWRDAIADPELDVTEGWAERMTAQIRQARDQVRPTATDQ